MADREGADRRRRPPRLAHARRARAPRSTKAGERDEKPAQLLVKGAITHVQGDTGGADGGIRVKGFKIGGGGGKGEVNATIYIVDSTTGQVLASKSVVGTHKRKNLGVGYNAGGWGAGESPPGPPRRG